MNKRITSIILVVMLLISMGTFLVSAATDRGNTVSYTRSIKALNNNTYIQSVTNAGVKKTYSAIKINSSSEVDEMNVWVMTNEDKWMSEKHTVKADGSITKIYYYEDTTFVNGAEICFWGEQSGITTKAISGKLYSY